MAFDNIPMTRPALMTAAAALALYDGARMTNPATVAAAADALAEVIRRNLSKLDKAPAAPKAKPTGFRVDLVAALALVNKVIERRNTIPVLSKVLLVAQGDALVLKATDLDMELTVSVDAPGVGVWTATVPAADLGRIVSKGSGDVVLAPYPDGERIEIMVGNALSTLTTLPAEDYTPLVGFSEIAEAVTFSMPAPPLAAMLRFVRPAVSTEETRYYLNGVYMHSTFEAGQPLLRFVATDGHRMNLDEMPAPVGANAVPGVIIPRKAVDVVTAVLAGQEAVEVSVTGQKVEFKAGRITLLSKVIDGAYPDYARVVPRDNGIIFDLDRKAFASAAERMVAISMEKSRSVVLEFGADSVNLTARNHEGGKAEEPVAAIGNDDIRIGFNGRYLRDACAALASERVVIAMSHPDSPALLTDPATPSRKSVLMPLRA